VPMVRKSRWSRPAASRLFVGLSPKSQVTESFRGLGMALSFASNHGSGGGLGKSFALLSLHPSEGKTSVLCSLGAVMAQNDRKVLLVDADIYKPELHSVFELSNQKGLFPYLLG